MANVQIQRNRCPAIEPIFGREYQYGYYYEETIATGATGDNIIIPILPANKAIGITLIAGANTGKFQATRSWDNTDNTLPSDATWFDLELEADTGTVANAILDPITGLRGVSTSGEIKIEVVI